MPSRRFQPKPKDGEEISVSVLAIDRCEEMLWISSERVPAEKFPPCIRSVLRAGIENDMNNSTGSKSAEDLESRKDLESGEDLESRGNKESRKGSHRIAAILAAFLGQAGWSETEAKQLWSQSNVAGVEDRIFTEWFRKMHCPKCETLKRASDGYPDLGIADLGLCQMDEMCREFRGPVEYAADIKSEEDRISGRLLQIKTIYHARVFDWSSGLEGEIELSEAEKLELEDLLKEQTEQKDASLILIYTRAKVRGRLRPKFFLKQAEGPRRQMLSDLL